MDRRVIVAGLTIGLGQVVAGIPAPSPERDAALVKMLAKDHSPQPRLTNVILRVEDRDILLDSVLGGFSARNGIVSFHFFLEFEDAKAPVRTKDTTPSVIFGFKGSPRGRVFLVKTLRDVPEDTRALRMGVVGLVSMTEIALPDRSWIVPVSRAELSPGVWCFTPQKPLEPGEYGLFQRGPGVILELFDFDVAGVHKDKEASSHEDAEKIREAHKKDLE